MSMSAKFPIYGEAHFEEDSVSFIASEILRLKPKLIVHELLDDVRVSNKDIDKQLFFCDKPGSVCDSQTNKDLFQLAVKVGADLWGCDLSQDEKEEIKTLPLKEQFKRRELKMLSILKQLPPTENIVVVVGDIHLREMKSSELGDASPIWRAVRDRALSASIIRTDKKYIEAF